MPRTGAPQSASRILNCYVCNQSFPKSEFNTELNEDGHECCPECGSEFVEIIDQAEQASTSTVASGSNVGGQSAARNDPPPGDAGAGGSRSGGASRAPRVEVHAMFHSDSGDAPDMPMSFVDAISRFAPLSLPNGQQAFVLQVQDGALLSPFTMGVPFSDAIAMNPEDWVVGDDLDAVVSRVLDAYMPPRRSTATEVLNTLPRLRVRGGPLSPRPTATLEAAARAATSTPSNPSHLHAPKFSSTDAVASSGGFGCDSGEEDDELARTGRAATSVGGDSAAEARAETIKYSDVLEGRHVDSLAPSTSMAAASASSAPTMAVAPAEAKAMEAKAEVAGDGFASCQPGELCTVCHDAFKPGGEVVELPCRHCFHEDCIMPWLRQQNTCPVCRMRLLEGNNRSSANSNSRSARHQASSQQADATPATNAARERERHSGAVRSNGGGDDDNWQPFSDWAHSQFAHLPSAQPRRPVSGAEPTDDFRSQRMVPLPLQQQQQGREAAGPAAGFPLLAALHPHPATGGLSTEERRAAEEALEPLRTRFAPIRLLNAPVFPTSGAGPVRGTASNIVMRPPWWPGAMAAGPTRGPLQGPTRTTDGATAQEQRRRTQEQQQGNNGGGGLANNPILNLFGTSGTVRPGSRSANGAPWAGGGGADGGTRSALRGGFLTSAGGGGTGATAGPVLERRQRTQRQTPPSPSVTATVGSGARSGMVSNQAAGHPSSVHAAAAARLSARALGQSLVSSLMSFTPPQSAARAASAAGTGDELRSSGGPGAANTAPCMSDRISELFDEVEEVLLRPDTAGRPYSSGTEDLARNVSGDVSARYTAEIRRMFGPLMGVPAAAAAAVPELLNSSIPTAGTEGSPRTSSSGLANQRSRAVMEDGEPGGGPEPTEDGPCRQVARHTRLQDAATQAHQRKTSSSSNDGGDVDENRGCHSASTSNTAVRGMGEGYGASGLRDTRSDLAGAATEATMRKISARAALATARRGHLVAAARAATPASALAVRSSGVRRRSGSANCGGESGSTAPDSNSGDSGEAAMTAAAAATNTSSAPPPCPDSGGGRGGFNPFAAVIGGAGAGLRLLGGVAGNLILRRRPSGGSRLNAAAKSQGDNGGSGSTEDSAREQQ